MKGLIRKNILVSIMKKEFAQMLRDSRMRGVLFGSPILLLIVFGYAVNMDVNNATLAVLDEDRTAMSRGLLEKFTGSRYFIILKHVASEKDVSSLMDQGKIDAFFHINRGLSKNVKTGKKSEVQVIIDGTDSNRGAIIMAYINQIMQEYFFDKYLTRIQSTVLYRLAPVPGSSGIEAAGSFNLNRGIRVNERAFFNPELKSRNYFLPGVIGFIISMITIMLTSMSIVKERESGTMEQIIVSPIRPVEFIMGKTIPFAIIGFIDMFVASSIAIFWFDVPFKGNILFLFFSALLYILSTLSVGMFISTISRTQQQAMMSFFLFFIPAILFSGFAFPIYSMPEIIQIITRINPLMYFIVIIRGIFLKGAGIQALWVELLSLGIIGLTLLSLSSWRLKRRME